MTTPTMLIISDGKPGHFNQSLGIADRLDDVNIKTIQIKYKKKWRDSLIRITTRLLYSVALREKLIKSLLKWGLDEQSFNDLFNISKPDLILSTGSSVASLNLLMSKLLKAKSVVCTRPSPLGINHFDLAILPEHSRPKRIPKNVLMTFGVPNRITPQSIEKAGLELSQKLNLSEKPVIGVLLGGDDPYYQIMPDLASGLCDALFGSHAQIALTTSRRTNPKTDKIIKSRLLDNPLCSFLVIANEGSQPNTVSGILGISNIVIVTEDSFSMVCESASSGKNVVILNVEKKGKGNLKRERVYRLMVERSFAKRSELADLKKLIIRLLNDTNHPKSLNDAQIAADAIREMLDY